MWTSQPGPKKENTVERREYVIANYSRSVVNQRGISDLLSVP